jgi:hypothetical protein
MNKFFTKLLAAFACWLALFSCSGDESNSGKVQDYIGSPQAKFEDGYGISGYITHEN